MNKRSRLGFVGLLFWFFCGIFLFGSFGGFFWWLFLLLLFFCYSQLKRTFAIVPHVQYPDERGGQLGRHPAHDAAAAEAGEQAGGQAGQKVHQLHQPPLGLRRQQDQGSI